MKIIYISKSRIPSETANSVHVMKMCQAFAANGHDVTLLSPYISKKQVLDVYGFYDVKDNFKITSFFAPEMRGQNIIYSLQVFLYLLFNRADVVYGRSLEGCYIAATLGFKTIFEAHAPMRRKKDTSIFNLLIKRACFDRLVVISESLKNAFLSNFQIKSGKIQVAHDAADEVFDLKSQIELHGKSDLFQVGYVGSMYSGKGMEIISQLASKVAKDTNFHIVGGSEKDIKHWKNKISNSNVHFYGFQEQKNVLLYINSFDACLLPNLSSVKIKNNSDNEIGEYTSPLKLFQYMSHKKPILASDLPVLREVLNENNSILCSTENIDEWVHSINKLKMDKQLRHSISNTAYSDFNKLYTWKIRACNVIKVF
ncbi:glycosyltransferase family 4 protein [Vibrio splendidus]|uniref:glycosyltransferase family 4 protein n=1 Tax=Vibrio splendidus TaxID=29497 RepID=UPI0011B23A6D|nr:glycosyltransferase family 4 protein [Vibrio splendidus]